MVQQPVKHPQVGRLDPDLGHGGDLLGTVYGGLHGRQRDRFTAGQCPPQGALHGGLAFAGRQLQDLQVLPRRHLLRVLAAQRVVGHAEMAAGE